MRFHLLLVLWLALASAAAFADWEVVRQTEEPSSAGSVVVHRRIDMTESDTGDRATVHLAMFSPKNCILRVVDNPDSAKNLASAMQSAGDDFVAGVNGGYFDTGFAPLGLRNVSGKTTSRLLRGKLMSGVFFARPGSCQILRTNEFASSVENRRPVAERQPTSGKQVGPASARERKLDAAIQCGPFLVEAGKALRGLESTRGARRTFSAVATGDQAALGYCSNATLSELGKILVSLAQPDFKIQRALNFDGGSSSAFWFKRADGSTFSIAESKYVRDFVAIARR